MEIGSYPFHEDGVFGSRLVLSSTDEALLSVACGDLEGLAAELGKSGVWEG